MGEEQPVTGLLREWRDGSEQALEQLTPLVYDELLRLARRAMYREAGSHTLQATALVNEAFVRLVDADVSWHDRVHFYAVAARTMRRVLVDHARARRSAKRGGDRIAVTLDDAVLAGPQRDDDLLELDEALARLASFDERKGQIVELHYFGGLTYDETAAVLDISPVTVHRDLKLAKAWLHHELSADDANP